MQLTLISDSVVQSFFVWPTLSKTQSQTHGIHTDQVWVEVWVEVGELGAAVVELAAA